MEDRDAIRALAALAQEHRLRVFRLLITAGPSGLPAGQIASQLGMPPSSLSFHLHQLLSAGLLESTREQRNIYYAVDTDAFRKLLSFLTSDCCAGRPELCNELDAIATL